MKKHCLTLPFNNWDIVAGDFDSDGYDDIALLFVKPLTGSELVSFNYYLFYR